MKHPAVVCSGCGRPVRDLEYRESALLGARLVALPCRCPVAVTDARRAR